MIISAEFSTIVNIQNKLNKTIQQGKYRFKHTLQAGSPITSLTSLPFWLYLVAITAAELITVLLDPMMGVITHSLILCSLLIQSAFIDNQHKRNLTLGLILVPLTRILSLALPLVTLPQIYWFPLIYTPLLAGTIVIMHIAGLTPYQTGLRTHGLLVQLVFGIFTGIALGVIEYLLLQPESLIGRFTFAETWLPALILICTTGFVEELIFRGVLQVLAYSVMRVWGILYVSLIFAVLHIGFLSVADFFFVLLVALLFAAVRKRTGSLIGVILSHGIGNCFLFLVGSFVLG